MAKDPLSYCSALVQFVKEICCCSEAGDWSPMTEDQIRKELQREKEKRSNLRRQQCSIAVKVLKDRIFGVRLSKVPKTEAPLDISKENSLINPPSDACEDTWMRRRGYAYSFRSNFKYERGGNSENVSLGNQSKLSYSTSDGNWSLSRGWKTNFNALDTLDPIYLDPEEFKPKTKTRNYADQLRLLKERMRRKRSKKSTPSHNRDSKVTKEQLRYDRNIKRHIRIRFMLSLRLRKYIRKKTSSLCPSNNKQTIEKYPSVRVPVRHFPKGGEKETVNLLRTDSSNSKSSSFGTNCGRVYFDVKEARNEVLMRCLGSGRENISEANLYAGNKR